MRFQRKHMCIAAAVLIAAMLGVGCDNSGNQPHSEETALEDGEYPIRTAQHLSYWIPELAAVEGYNSRADFPIMKEWKARTGIEVDWILPSRGNEQQQFNILLASGDMPDIVEWRWPEYTGGAEKALHDGIIVNLDELQQYTPNFRRAMETNAEFGKLAKTDSGNYYYFPVLRDTKQTNGYKLVVTSGYMMRKDWLDDLGLPVPQTIAQWYQTLKAFKEQKGAEAPLTLTLEDIGSGLVGAYGIYMDFYCEDGRVKYGRIAPEYKEFLTEMKKWFDEGLVDKNFATIDYDIVSRRILEEKSGAAFGWLGGQMGTWLTQGVQSNPKFDLVGVPFPVLNEGDEIRFTPKEAPVLAQGGAAISGSSSKKALAARFLDYFYSEEGHMLANFGVEGDTYVIRNGNPVYTDKILHNSDGLTIGQALSLYTRAGAPGPYRQDSRYSEQYYQFSQQREAQEIWKNTKADEYRLPPLMPASDEVAEYSEKMSNIKAYADEMFLKFIFGEESLDNFDRYVAEMNALGLERILEIQQEGLTRYENR